jgi:signal transduction histidine kinase
MQFSIVGQNNNNSGYFLGFTFFFILLNVPIFMFGLASIDSAIMFLRIAGSVLCILLCSAELWLNKSRRELFAYVVLTFCLPFLGIYSYLASGYELIWLVNTIVSVVLFFVLVSRGNAILFGLIGVLLGYGLQSHNTDIMVSNNMMLGQYSSFMLSVLLLGTLYYINLQSKKEKESLKTLGQSIAHDMGVPLSMGIMSTDLLSKALADKDYELAGKYVQEMHTYSKTAMQDVRVMLSSMSTDMSKKPSDWGDYSLSEIVQDAVCNYHLSEQQRSRITVAVETDYKFEGSAVLLRHVLHNLLANAFKYAGEQANISIFVDNVPRTMHGEGYTTLHIKDDGYGIAVDIKEKMFERHVSSGGHGIGLSFCREAMRLMNGDIKCISEKGKGTEFVLSFNN